MNRSRQVDRWLLATGLLAALTALVHTFAGTAEIHTPLLGSSLSEPVRLLLYACWHLVTATLLLSAAALLWSAFNQQHVGVLPLFIALLWLLSGFVFIGVALLFAGMPALLVLPQWILLIPVGVLGLIAQKRNGQRR